MKKQKKVPKPLASTLDLLPYRSLSDKGYIILNDNTFMDIVQISARDIRSANAEDSEAAIYDYATFLRGFSADFKIITLNYPTDTLSQRRHVLNVLERTENEKFRYFLNQKLDELETIEKECADREFYLMFFANSETQYQKFLTDISDMLGRVMPVRALSDEKKISILRKLSNISSKIIQ